MIHTFNIYTANADASKVALVQQDTILRFPALLKVSFTLMAAIKERHSYYSNLWWGPLEKSIEVLVFYLGLAQTNHYFYLIILHHFLSILHMHIL